MTKKRYCGVDENNKIYATGLELKRADWTPLAQNIQKDLLAMILIDDAGEEDINKYLNNKIENMHNIRIEDFIFEKIVDCTKIFKAKTKIVKAWISCGYKVKEDNKTYQCISEHGETLYGIRWICDNKGNPIGISEDMPLSAYKNKIGYEWYINNQILPLAKRITDSLSYKIGKKQKTLFNETTYL